MSVLRVVPTEQPLRGSVPLPDDEDILLCRLALSTLCRATSTIETNVPLYGAPLAFAHGLKLLGVQLEGQTELGPQRLRLRGVGLTGALEDPGTIDARGEPRVAALLIALAAGRPSQLRVIADPIVSELLGPWLTEFYSVETRASDDSAEIYLPAKSEDFRAPGLVLQTSGLLPWVKQAQLLLGLRAGSSSMITESIASMDHMERALLRARVPISIQGTSIELHPPRDQDALAPEQYLPVGSMSCAVAVLAAGLLTPGSEVMVRGVGLGPSRADALTLLRLLGASVGMTPKGDHQGEPICELSVSGTLHPVGGRTAEDPFVLAGETVARLGDSILPFLALLGASGSSTLLGDLVAGRRGGDPRVFQRAAGLLRSAGCQVMSQESGFLFVPRREPKFRPIVTTTGGDGRLAVFATLVALGAGEPSEIDDVDCLRHLFPRWPGTLRALGARVEVLER